MKTNLNNPRQGENMITSKHTFVTLMLILCVTIVMLPVQVSGKDFSFSTFDTNSYESDSELIPDEGMFKDAKEYALVMGVDIDEAIHRLNIQHLIGDLNAKLAENELDAFGGLWIQHEPDYRVI